MKHRRLVWKTGTMINRKIIYFLVIFQILPPGNKVSGHRFLSKLVTQTRSSTNQNIEKKYRPIEADLKCRYKCLAMNEPAPRYQAGTQARFIDLGSNDSVKSSEMEAPASKFSIFNLLSDNDDREDVGGKLKLKREEEDDEDEDDDEEEEEEENNEDGSDDDDIGFSLFGPEYDTVSDKLKGPEGEDLLKQYHRQRLRMHNLVFPLLLAYKLKFFTVIPLLLGSLVLLIGTTGIAGFFFALFAAALGIHVKGQQQ